MYNLWNAVIRQWTLKERNFLLGRDYELWAMWRRITIGRESEGRKRGMGGIDGYKAVTSILLLHSLIADDVILTAKGMIECVLCVAVCKQVAAKSITSEMFISDETSSPISLGQNLCLIVFNKTCDFLIGNLLGSTFIIVKLKLSLQNCCISSCFDDMQMLFFSQITKNELFFFNSFHVGFCCYSFNECERIINHNAYIGKSFQSYYTIVFPSKCNLLAIRSYSTFVRLQHETNVEHRWSRVSFVYDRLRYAKPHRRSLYVICF